MLIGGKHGIMGPVARLAAQQLVAQLDSGFSERCGSAEKHAFRRFFCLMFSRSQKSDVTGSLFCCFLEFLLLSKIKFRFPLYCLILFAILSSVYIFFSYFHK